MHLLLHYHYHHHHRIMHHNFMPRPFEVDRTGERTSIQFVRATTSVMEILCNLEFCIFRANCERSWQNCYFFLADEKKEPELISGKFNLRCVLVFLKLTHCYGTLLREGDKSFAWEKNLLAWAIKTFAGRPDRDAASGAVEKADTVIFKKKVLAQEMGRSPYDIIIFIIIISPRPRFSLPYKAKSNKNGWQQYQQQQQ